MTKRILSGMRPTGKLHLGHYVGALENWIQLQNEMENDTKKYDTYFLIADYHSLTTSLDSSRINEHTLDMVADWISAGINPKKSPIFRQSQVKQHAELFLVFSMLITSARLERNPSLKEQVRDMNLESVVYGHLGYPVLQSADILLYKGNLVPVGEDQLPHIEITREIARKFNQSFQPIFEEPEAKITAFARLVGLDGKAKMSKSLGNSILLSENEKDVPLKMNKAVTDIQKIKKNDPGRPEICTVFSYHTKFTSKEKMEEIDEACRTGTMGCVECKKICSASVSQFLTPFIERREKTIQSKDTLYDILLDGEKQARITAEKTMQEVRSAMLFG